MSISLGPLMLLVLLLVGLLVYLVATKKFGAVAKLFGAVFTVMGALLAIFGISEYNSKKNSWGGAAVEVFGEDTDKMQYYGPSIIMIAVGAVLLIVGIVLLAVRGKQKVIVAAAPYIAADQETPAPYQPAPVQPLRASKYCGQCGAAQTAENAFCPKCGKKVSA